MIKVIYPGSFDPPTNGHINIIQRASSLFDQIEVVIAVNPRKQYTFNAKERNEMMQRLIRPYPNVNLHIWDRLIVDFIEKVGTRIIIRGVRALSDFGYEFELAMTNKSLNPKVETIFIPTDPKYFVLRSSAIKEIAMNGGDISNMVPTFIAQEVRRKVASP